MQSNLLLPWIAMFGVSATLVLSDDAALVQSHLDASKKSPKMAMGAMSLENISQRIDDQYTCTFAATGCVGGSMSLNWNGLPVSNTEVWETMHEYCAASSKPPSVPQTYRNMIERILCCGSMSCCVQSCTTQTEWTQSCENQNNDHQCPDHMSCGDAARGFVNHGDPITGWIKSCPKDLPFNQPDKTCASGECLVDPDRYTCCRDNKCNCENGVATDGNGTGPSKCEHDGAHDCQSCNAGFDLDAVAGLGEQTCIPYTCQCEHGTPTVGTGSGKYFCSEQGMEDCSSCAAGYHPSDTPGDGSQTCIPNTCFCSNGNATVADGSGGFLCEVNGSEDCSSCDDWFSLGTAGLGNQTCTCEDCLTGNLPTDGSTYDWYTCLSSMCNGHICTVGCADGLQGAEKEWRCVNGTLTGDLPTCTNVTCNAVKAGPLLTAHTYSDCETELPTNTCSASCLPGYWGQSQTYTCQENGNFTPFIPMNCTPSWCDASHQPANGNNGSCTDQLASGESCHIECDDGYERHGAPTSCHAGTLENVSTCQPKCCDATKTIDGGSLGECTSTCMPSGDSCAPECDEGHYLLQEASCSAGVLTGAICEKKCKCELIYLKQCVEQYGYWSEAQEHLDYPGCEGFCNTMNLADGITIYGCELEAVTGSDRSSKGTWCFAHSNPCEYGEALENNAAAKCEHYTSQR